ncbi:hypothetical protein KC973_01880 [Candidatus Saccharibacteria bacterium]|nr:hypothetical protein [Candidatus Saccharibacteria bacterium]
MPEVIDPEESHETWWQRSLLYLGSPESESYLMDGGSTQEPQEEPTVRVRKISPTGEVLSDLALKDLIE